MRGRNPNVDCKAVERIADSLGLSKHRSTRLYLSLCDARGTFDIWRTIDKTPKKTALARRLSDIEQSVARIAAEWAFSDSIFKDALAQMGIDGERWARDKERRHAGTKEPWSPRNAGFDAMLLGGVMHYGAEHFVSSWFERALIVRDILKIAKARLKREPSLGDQF
jgi:hypothetical protein